MWTLWTPYDAHAPNAAMEDWRQRVDLLLDALRTGGDLAAQQTGIGFPRVDLYDTEGAYVAQADVPGLREQDIQLQLHDGVLTLAGERKAAPPTGFEAVRHERAPLKFSRSFALPGQVDADAVTASVQDGVLTVTLPKSPQARPRQIRIQAN